MAGGMAQARDPTTADALLTVLGFLRRTIELAADDVRPIAGGWVASTPSLPLVWGLNHVRLAGPITSEQAVELTEEHQRELPYRQLAVEHEDSARALEWPLRETGWRIDRELLMVLTRPSDGVADAADVVEPEEEAVCELMRRWVSDDDTMTRQALDQVVAATSREGSVRNARNLGIRDEDGELVAMTKLYSDGQTAQVEDVYTLPAWRGRGCARRLICRALAVAHASDHRLVFIVADADGWPRYLYERLGFEPIGRIGMFHREP